MEVRLNRDQVVIVAVAVNWSLNTIFTKSPQPAFSADERLMLSDMLFSLYSALQHNRPVTVSLDHVRIDGGNVVVGIDIAKGIERCVRAFDSEVGHSPDEIHVLTGLPITILHETRDALSHITGVV